MSNINLSSLNRDQGSGVSDRYKVIKTGDLVSQFVAQGYEVTQLKQSKTRRTELVGYTKHLLRMRHPSLKVGIDGLFPEIILKNSYNGTSSFEIMMGIFRLVCSNGLVVGTTYESLKVRHVGDVMSKVLTAMTAIQNQTSRMETEIREMSQRQLSQNEIVEFASQVAKSLIPDSKQDETGNVIQFATNVQVLDLVQVNRTADSRNDLWTVLNRIQENALHGGLRYNSVDTVSNRVGNRTSRRINSIDRSLEINRLVWDQATKLIAA